MDIHVTSRTNKSWVVVFIVKKVRQLFGEHGVSNIVSLVGYWVVQGETM